MKNLNRRDVFWGLSAFAAMSSMAAKGQAALPGENVLSHSETFPFDKLPVKKTANGGASRAVVQGVLATGESVEMHETTLPPGQMPHPAGRWRAHSAELLRQGPAPEFRRRVDRDV